MFFQGFAAAGLALWSELERLFFVIGFLARDHAMDDTRQLVRGGGGSFRLAQLALHPAQVAPHLGLGSLQAKHSEPERARQSTLHLARFGLEHFAAADPVVRAQAHPRGESFRRRKGRQ